MGSSQTRARIHAPALAGGFSTTASPGKSLVITLNGVLSTKILNHYVVHLKLIYCKSTIPQYKKISSQHVNFPNLFLGNWQDLLPSPGTLRQKWTASGFKSISCFWPVLFTLSAFSVPGSLYFPSNHSACLASVLSAATETWLFSISVFHILCFFSVQGDNYMDKSISDEGSVSSLGLS